MERMSAPKDRVDDAQEDSIPNFDGEHHLEARFECPICLQCLKNPVLTTCGHRFCCDCIHLWLKNKGNCCPVDNQPLSIDNDLFPDNFTRREIGQLGSLLGTRNSDNSGEQTIECAFKEVGCMATFSKQELPLHLETQIHQHLDLLNVAYNKLSCTIKEQKLGAKAQEASSLWEPENKSKNAQSDANETWQGLVRSLYERIVLLEQQNREQGILIENLKVQITSYKSAVEKIQTAVVLNYCNGIFIWNLQNFSSNLSNPQFMIYSPGFYTSPYGYKFCSRLNFSRNDLDCLALHIHLMKSDHDQSLEWPFTGRISFTLVNGRDTRRNRRDVMISRPELEAFNRSDKDINPRGFGYSEFVSVTELRSEGFLFEDRLVIKIQIQSI